MMTILVQPYQHRVQYYETDAMGIVHHSNYIRWFEEARIDWLDQIGFGYDKMEAAGIYIPVLGVSCQYKNMTSFGQTVVVIPKVTAYDGLRLSLSYQVLDMKTGETCAEGGTDHCFLNAQTRFPARIARTHPDIDAVFRTLFAESTPR